MGPDRRSFLAGSLAAAAIGVPAAAGATSEIAAASAAVPMYGRFGRMTATPGQRDALIAILVAATDAMPGCLSYVVAQDSADADAVWISEVWTSREAHAASLTSSAVRVAIAKARPLIAGFDKVQETVPVGGVGLPRR